MSNIHFSGLDNVKMTCITHNFPSKLLLGKDMFKLTFVDLVNETSISIWGFEKMNILKKYFCFFLLVTQLNSHKRNETNLLMNSDTLICI